MKSHRLLASLAILLASSLAARAENPAKAAETIALTGAQKEYLRLEPILLTARLDSAAIPGLPTDVGSQANSILRFEIKPAVKPRRGGKPLPLEARAAKAVVQVRTYDLQEWFQFPAEGSFTVCAVVEHKGSKLTSAPVAFTIGKPGKTDAEFGPVDRIHHIPWTNYDTNSFCGDTFDVVKRWPKSKLTRHCHYWNGRYSQHKNEYDKAIASYRTVVEQYPDFILADHAVFGIAECLLAQKKTNEARKQLTDLRDRLKQRAAKSKGQTAVGHLVEEALRGNLAASK
jgi:hypothetical protein